MTLRQHEEEGYRLGQIRKVAKVRDKRRFIRNTKDLNRSWLIDLDCQYRENEAELLQYKIFDNDSDEDVFEGLGNTTLDMKGNIAAGCSSDEDSMGIDNNQMDASRAGADKVDKKIIEIAV